MGQISLSHNIDCGITCTSESYIEWCNINRLQSVSVSEYVDDRIQEALSELKSKLSAMECTGCGGNIDTETLKCNCCGRQYRLVAAND